MENITALFLQQSYLDCMDEYTRSLRGESRCPWDAVILTASNERQAKGYRRQLASRPLPAGVHFAVVPDKNGERIGSGGATLSVIKYVKEHFGTLDKKKILVIHSGGDSKRIPCYSACGKLFSPVPHEAEGRALTLFDELLIATSQIPQRIGEGMLLLSGDVLLLFNPLKIDFQGSDAAAISFLEDVETGKNHGVFAESESGNVKRFLHKQSVQTLKENGAVNDRNEVNIDTGAVLFSKRLLSSLSAVTEKFGDLLISTEARLSLYGDFLYPLAEDSTLEDFFNEAPEGDFTPELHRAREIIWDALHRYSLKLLRLSPAKFVHFGTTGEVLKFMTEGVCDYSALGWKKVTASSVRDGICAYCSAVSDRAQIGEGTYIENSTVGNTATVGRDCFISCCDIEGVTVPDGVVLHTMAVGDNYATRIFGIYDNPKEKKLFGLDLGEIERMLGAPASDSLWTAKIYPLCKTPEEALSSALHLYALCHGGGDISIWKNQRLSSLQSGFEYAHPDDAAHRSLVMQDKIKCSAFMRAARDRLPVSEAAKILGDKVNDHFIIQLTNHANKADFSEKIRVPYYLGEIYKNKALTKKCFEEISNAIANPEYNENAVSVTDGVEIHLPLRVNFGGGWTDTPPYCIENGGAVLNAAITHGGQYPVLARITKIPELKLRFISRDMDAEAEYDDIRDLQNTGDPFDPFALQKACLLACGIIPEYGGNLAEILHRIGGGFELRSEVIGVPKGSGLGTSSILSAACARAVYRYFGMDDSEIKISDTVLAMEQIMSTGGGWQDQIGGLVPGIKLITSRPGMRQELSVKTLNISEETRTELSERLCLIWTGQRRLARNLLRSVMGRYIGGDGESVYALSKIKELAPLMAQRLEVGDIEGFASLMNEHWELSKMIDSGSTNPLIDGIFEAVDDLISARLVCGAGGGGFLQVILKKGVTKDDLKERLGRVFSGLPIDIWDAEIVF